MAKIAGRKNDGAWQAGNNFLAALDPTTLADVEEQMEKIPELISYLATIREQYGNINIPLPSYLATITSWVSEMMITGIPRDVFLGKVSYDIWQKSSGPPPVTYKPLLAAVALKAGHAIRAFIANYQFGLRQVGWLAKDTPHPSSGGSVAAMRAARRADPVGWVAQRRVALNDAISARKLLAARGSAPAEKTAKKQLTA